jgi:hypothetical protein
MPRFSAKALILSNLTHWGAFAFGFTVCIIVYYAGATIATDGAGAKFIVDEMKSSIGLDAASLVVGIIAPLLAGYVGAKLAPEAKLTHGVLATSSWLLFNLYGAVWGLGTTNSHMPLPEWLELAVSYAVPSPALLGAYLYQRRQKLIPETPATARYRQEFASQAPLQRPETVAPGVARSGTATALLVSVIIGLLLTAHEQSMLLLAVVGATVIMLLVGLAEKKFKSRRS